MREFLLPAATRRLLTGLVAGTLALSGLDCGWGIAGTLVGEREPRDPSKRIRPEHDLEYLGAFRFPDERSAGTTWGYGGDGMTYDPAGDPDGPDDGHPGSLFSMSHRRNNLISEISIPRPSKAADRNELPVARTLQPFTDVTGGRNTGQLTGTNLADIEILSDPGAPARERKLHWVLFQYYLPPVDMITLGRSNLDFTNVQPEGPWRVGRFAASATSKYLFEIPKEWADRYVKGRTLAAGRSRQANKGSWGPALYAVAPLRGTAPEKGSEIDATELLKYPDRQRRVKDYSNADEWPDGAWLTAGRKSAVVIAGTKGERSVDSGFQYYGPSGPYGCGAKGYHAEPYYGAMLFYDTEDLAAVARGSMRPWEPQPYAVFQVEHLVRRPCRPILGGVGFDRASGLLYVLEQETDGGEQRKPLAHVWRVRDAGLPADTTPPSVPTDVRATADRRGVSLRWKPSSDDVGGVIYVVYRDDAPIALVTEPRFRDRHGKAGDPALYRIEARDSVSNRSSRTGPVSAPAT